MWKELTKDLSVRELVDALGILCVWIMFLVFFVLLPGALFICFLRWIWIWLPGLGLGLWSWVLDLGLWSLF